LPALMVLLANIFAHRDNDIMTALLNTHWTTWVLIAVLIIVSVIILLFAEKIKTEK